jgi:3-mercaptopyruvate sulfurtransferase SseA
MENQNDPDFVIIDCRTPEEYAGGHIEDSVNIDYRSDAFGDELEKLDRDRTYLIYCRSGGAAARLWILWPGAISPRFTIWRAVYWDGRQPTCPR